MNTQWMKTNEWYQQIIAEPDMTAKEQCFREYFSPFFEALRASAPHIPVKTDDAIEAAREWNMLLPEDLTQTPEALRKLETADAWTVAARALDAGAARFEPYQHQVNMSDVSGWLLLTDPTKAEPSNRGYTGFQFPGHIVGIFDTPNDYNIPRLPGLVVHELHHIVRLGLFPWNMQSMYSVADYVVLEGMAESFAAQLYGEDVVGYYAVDITPDDLETARRVVRNGLNTSGDVRGYIFGDHFAEQWHFPKIGMPPFGGYAVGYQIVQAYLKRTDKTVEEATFIPSDEIVAESGYLD